MSPTKHRESCSGDLYHLLAVHVVSAAVSVSDPSGRIGQEHPRWRGVGLAEGHGDPFGVEIISGRLCRLVAAVPPTSFSALQDAALHV